MVLIVTACLLVAWAVPGPALAAPAAVTVGHRAVGPPVPAGFLGLANEYWDVQKELGTNPAAPDPVFEQILKNLAPYGGVTLRIGGDSTDWTWWPIPGMKTPRWVRWTMTPNWAAVTKRLAVDLNAHLILGLNMEADSPRVASTELREIRANLGGSVPVTFELGNEPELYSKFPFYRNAAGRFVHSEPPTYSYADMTAEWHRIAHALPHAPLAGPGFSSFKALPYVSQFLAANRRLSLLTVHSYALKPAHCHAGGGVREEQLFEPSSLAQMAQSLDAWTQLARRSGVGVRVDEMNAVTCGGIPAVSDSFGPALWALNILPLYARVGASGVNFQSRPDTAQNLVQLSDTHSGWQVAVQPEYYGLVAFAQLTPPGSRLLRMPAMPAGLFAWAVRTPQKQIHVVVTDVTGQARTVVVRIPGGVGPASVEVLRSAAGRLGARGGVTLGGQTLSPSTGALSGPPATVPATPVRGAYRLHVAPASAAILTVGQ